MAVLDGTSGAAQRQARVLGGFLHDGVTWGTPRGAGRAGPCDVTVAFYADLSDRERLVRLAPTRRVRLVRTAAQQPDLMAAALTTFAAGPGGALFVLAGGALGTEVATRLACRTGGGVVTEVLDVAVEAERLVCHRSVYSNHLTGRFELTRGPWCVTTDSVWLDASEAPPVEHEVLADVDAVTLAGESGDSASTVVRPLDDIELLESPATGDLETAKFVVVAGRGVGSREGVERIAAAARRMGAAFGVTRPVAMNAWAPMDRLIGVSGTRTAPAVCLVAGASGAPAFLWGVERAGVIAAVDLDEHAAIAAEADVLVVDDGVAVVEALADLVARERG